MRSYSPSDQQTDSRHSSRNSSVDRRYDRLTRSPEAFNRDKSIPLNDDRPNKNFFHRNKHNNNGSGGPHLQPRDNNHHHRRDLSLNHEIKDWSQEVEDEENRRRSTRSYEPGVHSDRRYRNRR